VPVERPAGPHGFVVGMCQHRQQPHGRVLISPHALGRLKCLVDTIWISRPSARPAIRASEVGVD
jgi:hypothetical protein